MGHTVCYKLTMQQGKEDSVGTTLKYILYNPLEYNQSAILYTVNGSYSTISVHYQFLICTANETYRTSVNSFNVLYNIAPICHLVNCWVIHFIAAGSCNALPMIDTSLYQWALYYIACGLRGRSCSALPLRNPWNRRCASVAYCNLPLANLGHIVQGQKVHCYWVI